MTRPILRLQEVEKVYPGPPPVQALRPADLTVTAGDFLSIVGPSGSGKSTLLNLLGLLDRPSAGRLEFAGIDVADLSEVERTALRGLRIGFVFQAFHLLTHRSALENVALGMVYAGVRSKERMALAAEMLDRVGLGSRMHAAPSELSGGEQQRVATARALVPTPQLLLCDEPTGNLDSATAAAILDLLGQLNEDGLTVMVITHNPAVAAYGRRVVSMRDGLLNEAARS